jgi:NAD+ diphosphatase
MWWGVQGSRLLVGDGGRLPVGPAPGDGAPIFVGILDGTECWAVHIDAPVEGFELQDLRMLHGTLGEQRWAIAGRAVQLVEWDHTHKFCGRCATPTEESPGERARRCPRCGLLAFPRLAPAIITLVTRDDTALLAQGAAFGIAMYSCLAGFVEPGETLEECVAREVFEEVGILVRDVRYQGSQPWPFPHSLMLGFRAEWESGELDLDPVEIADAGWYRADKLPMIPPGVSIARRLIDAWVAEQ